MKRRRFNCALVAFVVVVSGFDACLVSRYAASIGHLEQNPCGRWLIALGGGDPVLFLHVKAAGTAAAAVVLVRLERLDITAGVAAFQLGLVLYLLWG